MTLESGIPAAGTPASAYPAPSAVLELLKPITWFPPMLLAGQLLMMQRLLRDPIKHAYWYSGFGVPLYVLGVMASAVALRLAG